MKEKFEKYDVLTHTIWNTFRGYAAEGQIIEGWQLPALGVILFNDRTRGIDGFVGCEVEHPLSPRELRDRVMAAYDGGKYSSLLACITRTSTKGARILSTDALAQMSQLRAP